MLRYEDMGKQLYFSQDYPNLSREEISKVFKEYLAKHPLNKTYLINNKNLNYNTFINIKSTNLNDTINNLCDLLADLPFVYTCGVMKGQPGTLAEIKDIEYNENLDYLEVWTLGEVFIFAPYEFETI